MIRQAGTLTGRSFAIVGYDLEGLTATIGQETSRGRSDNVIFHEVTIRDRQGVAIEFADPKLLLKLLYEPNDPRRESIAYDAMWESRRRAEAADGFLPEFLGLCVGRGSVNGYTAFIMPHYGQDVYALIERCNQLAAGHQHLALGLLRAVIGGIGEFAAMTGGGVHRDIHVGNLCLWERELWDPATVPDFLVVDFDASYVPHRSSGRPSTRNTLMGQQAHMVPYLACQGGWRAEETAEALRHPTPITDLGSGIIVAHAAATGGYLPYEYWEGQGLRRATCGLGDSSQNDFLNNPYAHNRKVIFSPAHQLMRNKGIDDSFRVSLGNLVDSFSDPDHLPGLSELATALASLVNLEVDYVKTCLRGVGNA
jgi:hypothetical protein